MSNYKWKPGWYADRLHAESENPAFSLCSFRFPTYLPDGEWFTKKLEEGVPRCKKCQRIIDKEKNPDE